jgi:TQXA domain-containing protein
MALSLIATAAIAVLAAPAASAVPVPPGATPRAGSNTQMVMSGTGPGQGVAGYIANPDNPFDPVADGYPTTNPGSGFTRKDEGFAGVIYGRPTDGSPQLTLYCIDILTNTYSGIGYVHGTWSAAEVPNVGYVARLLNSYYPKVPGQPAGLSTNEKAAAVQAAIWFFSDRYVLRTQDPLHDAAAAIVAATIAAGPFVQPPPPSLTISPSVASGAANSTVGPYTVNSTATTTVTAVGANMFADAGATQPIAPGATVPNGQQIWLKSTGNRAAVLQATAKADVPSGNVYLYDGNTPGVTDAQKLILSQDATLTTTVNAVAEFVPTGSLTVTKRIIGGAAGSQGQVTVVVTCGGVILSPALSVPPGTAAGTTSHTYDDIPAGAVCTVEETHDGHTSTVEVTVTGNGKQVEIPDGGTATATITDAYTFVPGSLVVRKSIRGDGAGRQGAITIQPTCGGTDLDPFVIPAGTAAGITEKTYDDIPAGTSCTVTETANGENSKVTVTVTGGGTVTVPAGDVVESDVVDDYSLKPGELTVSKTISGTGAGQQGPITITVTCVKDGVETVLQPVINIPAGAAAGTTAQTYTDIPGDSICAVVEDPDGHTTTIGVVKGGDGQTVTIPPGGSATADLDDTYVTGELVVNKTIRGAAAGSQGEVTIHTVCGATALTPDLVIPAGSRAGSYSHAYPDVIAGATCTITETSNGSSSTVTVTTTGSPQTVTISPGGTGTADVTDDYAFVPGSLRVTKTITGSSAGDQGEIRIQVDCGEQVATPDFVIPAGSTGSPSRTYTDIPAGTSCTVTEVADGRSTTVSVDVTGSPQDVTVAPAATTVADLTDTYGPADGALVVRKTITGPSAGKQGRITIQITCGGTALPDFVIAAGTTAGTTERAYHDIAAGSTCTVTEIANGATSTVEVKVDDDKQTMTVPAGEVVDVALTDTASDRPGTLVAVKRITGPAAGRQGDIGILVICAFPINVYGFLIPADTARGTVSRAFSDIPADSACAVLEVFDGHTDSVSVTTDRRALLVGVGAAQTVRARIINTYGFGALANTGPPVAQLLGTALGAIALGVALCLGGIGGGRRRRPARHSG